MAQTTHLRKNVVQLIEYEMRIDRISKLNATNAAERIENDRQEITNMLTHLNEGHELGQGQVDNIERPERFDKDRKRPRTLLVKIRTEVIPRKILAKGYLMKDYDKLLYISPSLSESDRKIEQNFLEKMARTN